MCTKGHSAVNKPFVIDNDAGGDDALAIFVGLLYEKHYNGPKLVGLTTCHGNTVEDNVYANNQKVLKVAGRQDVPIYRGSKGSIVNTPPMGGWYGRDGLGDNDDVYTDLVPAKEEHAVNALIRLSKMYPGDLTVITTGSLTNVALAIRLDPDFISRLNHLYIGAGHIHGDVAPKAELNARTDVEAYHIVMQNATPDNVTILPFSQVKIHLNFSREWRQNVFGAIQSDIIKAQNKFEKVSLTKNDRWPALDPAVVAIFLRPDLVGEYKYSKNEIIMCGDNRGMTTHTFCGKAEANVRVIFSAKTEEYRQFLFDLFFQKDTPSK